MKASDVFKTTIQNYLKERAASDPLFAQTLSKPEKNIDECVTYILNEVQKSGCNGFADEEIHSMAVHYYDEDKINIGSKSKKSFRAVVNHTVELTEEEMTKAKVAALTQAQKEAHDAISGVSQGKKRKTGVTPPASKQGSLF